MRIQTLLYRRLASHDRRIVQVTGGKIVYKYCHRWVRQVCSGSVDINSVLALLKNDSLVIATSYPGSSLLSSLFLALSSFRTAFCLPLPGPILAWYSFILRLAIISPSISSNCLLSLSLGSKLVFSQPIGFVNVLSGGEYDGGR